MFLDGINALPFNDNRTTIEKTNKKSENKKFKLKKLIEPKIGDNIIAKGNK